MASDPRRPLIGVPPPETLQDSLQALVGGGVPVHRSGAALEVLGLGSRLQGSGGLLGAALPFGKNRVFLRPEGAQPEREARGTLMHEFGHVADFRKAFPDAARVISETTPEGEIPEEHYADTFLAAMRFLQSPVPEQARSRLIQTMPREQQAMLQALLRHPLFADHPMAQRGLLAVGVNR